MLKLSLIKMANGLLQTFTDSFISFDGILSIPVDLLRSIFLKSCSTSQAETFGRWLFPAVRFFSMLFSLIAFDIFMTSKRLEAATGDVL